MQETKTTLLNDEALVNKIYFIRGQKVMLDRDLAELYGVETKQLKRQVKRNIYRFPEDFMFELNEDELENWRRQFGTSNSIIMGLRYLPMAFTEQGIIMLSSVLNSKRAIEVNIRVVRIFIRLREIISTNKEIMHKLEQLEKRMDGKDQEIQNIFAVLRQLVEQPQPEQSPREQIGYKTK
jgi:hypothetical protein